MKHSNNFEELGGIKKGSCMALYVHVCVREKERKEIVSLGRGEGGVGSNFKYYSQKRPP